MSINTFLLINYNSMINIIAKNLKLFIDTLLNYKTNVKISEQ